MKSKKVKEVATLYLDRIDQSLAGQITYNYACMTHSNIIMPDKITVKTKRQPNTINEFLKVNDLLEKDVLEELIKNYK